MAKIQINNPRQIINGGAKKYYFKVKGLGGPKGDKGDKGDTGSQGPQGPQGNAATVSVGSTTTLPVGYDATVTNSGSIYNAVLDFGIPQGPRGPQGAKGDKGDKGDKGEQGNTGPTGPAGTNATVYIGTTITGNPGTQASVYNSGTENNAVLNFTIPRGDVGPSVPLVQETGYSTTKAMSQNATTEALNGKQNTLTAGSNIQISGSTISATDTKYSAGNGITLTGTQFSANTSVLATKNDLGSYYTKTQIDSQMAAKQDDLVAGSNIQIAPDGKTISATDTTYTAGTGLTLTGTEFSADTAVLATQTDLTTALAPKLQTEVVSTLPTTGDGGKLYLTPKTYTTGTASGNPITIALGEDEGAIDSFKLDGDTFQQTYTGKNLFDIEQYSNALLRGGGTGVSLAKIDSRTLRATNKIKQSNNFCGIPVPNYTQLLGQTVTVSGSITRHDVPNTKIVFAWNTNGVSAFGQNLALNQDGAFSLTQSIPESAPSGATGLLVVIYANGEGTNGEVNSYVDWSDIQLEVGSPATSYEPFVGGTPSPNPDYPQQIQTVTGEQTITIASTNLFDGVFELGNINTTTGDNTDANTMIRSKNYCEIKPSTQYTISVVNGGNVALRFYQADGTFIETGTTGASPNTFTSPANAGRVRFIITSNTNLNTQAQCEAGNSATTWTPYYPKQTLPLNLGSVELCKLGTYQDYIYKDGDDWKVHKETNKVTLDGSEEWRYYNTVCQLYSITDYAISNNIPYCGAFKGVSNVAGLSNVADNTCCFTNVSGQTTPRFYVRYSDKFTSADSITNYLTSNPTSLYYAIATATNTIITDTNLIAQLEAVLQAKLQASNTITNTANGSNLAGDMELNYHEYDPHSRYNKWLWLDINENYEQIGS